MGVIVVVCAAFSHTISEAKCYKWWPYILLALYLDPKYYIILHAYHQNNYNIVTLLVF